MPRPIRKQTAKPSTATTKLQDKENNTPVTRRSQRQQEEQTPPPKFNPPAQFETPSAKSPKYGRSRLSNSSFRRVSLANNSPDGSVFDDLIDGFSPIKRAPPPESENDLDLVAMPDRIDEEEEEEEDGDGDGDGDSSSEKQDEDEEEESSAEFDIDSLVNKGKKRRISAEFDLELLGRERVGAGLPKRNRTLKYNTAETKAKKPTTTTTTKKTKTTAKKPAAATAKKTNPLRSTTTTNTTTKAKTVAASNKIINSKKDSLWPIDAKITKYFDDIDGFELAEEAV
ncbi:hypothetical protein LPJ66_003604 [Kickxella alabastrina]|uniref:Uncharacterized protein n=1 Tax=Kickxella alabastrina TaxID=61397 RepID=A0ACC1IJM8_9FUNG|nr:hypothetical protein LPJ66_003604 [Kickxella alabastrina]